MCWTGWYNILWAPIMCSGAFGLQGIPVKLVYPFRTDNYGITAGRTGRKVSHFAMDTAWNVDWCSRIYATTEGEFYAPYCCVIAEHCSVKKEYNLLHFNATSLSKI